MELKINKEFQQLIPPLTDEEYSGLEQSIINEGCRDAILIWNDTIVDGHNRYNICQEHGIDFRVDVIHFDSDDEAKVWIIRNQFSRRNLKIEDRIELALLLEDFFKDKAKKRQGTRTDIRQNSAESVSVKQNSAEQNTRNEVAKIAGVSHDSVSKYKKIKEAGKEAEIKEGKSINKVHKEIVREERKQKFDAQNKELAAQYVEDDAIKIWHGDFYELCKDIPDESVDLVLTDPPYPIEFIHVWAQLGEVAARVLKPSGFLATYTGHIYLDKVIIDLSKYLDYYWIMSLYHTGPTARAHARNMIAEHKPILIYQKPPFKKQDTYVGDVVRTDKMDKKYHEWGQGELPVEILMNHFSKPNDLILEPFLGGGTTAAVAKRLSRRCIGIDNDLDAVNTTKSRLMEGHNELG